MTDRPRVLYVDALSDRHALSTTRGIAGAYRKVAWLKTFDYREVARRHGPGVPWSRPEIWEEDKWSGLVADALNGLNGELVDVARWFKPDFVHLGKCELITGSAVATIKETGAFVAHFYGDLWREVKPWVADIGTAADITLFYHQDTVLTQAYLDAGCQRAGFWWVGTDPDIFRPLPAERDFDVVFMGRCVIESGDARTRLIRLLAGCGVHMHVYSGGWGDALPPNDRITMHPFVDEDDFAWACSRARIALAISSADVQMYTSWRRVFNTMACGTFLLTRRFPGLERVFENGKHLVWFTSDDEAVGLAQQYLRDDAARESIAAAGRAEVLRAHTWDQRIDEMLRFWRADWHRPTS